MAGNVKTAREVGATLAQRARERMADPRAVWGIPWPFKGLNTLTGGIHSPEMTILAARPSVGKTAMMVQIADGVQNYLKSDRGRAEHPGGGIKLVLCESTAEVFLRRWACLRSGVSQKRIQNGRASEAEYSRWVGELRDLARMPIRILDAAQSLDEVMAFLSDDRDGPTAWWALDYVQKCPLSPSRPNDGSVGPITTISGALTEAAKRVAPGLVLAHTPRDVDKRDDRRPRMGDLKGGSALEGDARVVLALYREDIYQKPNEADAALPRPAELLLLKQNDGDSGRTIEMVFRPRLGTFEDISDLFEDEDEA